MSESEYLPIMINGKTYIPLDFFLTSKSKDYQSQLDSLGCILQRVRKINTGGMFSSAHAVLTLLVPADKVEEYGKI